MTCVSRPGTPGAKTLRMSSDRRLPANRTAVKRYGMSMDFEGVSILLASRASDFITGAIIIMDGGLSLAM
jgi:NAD(P)-dependent dehydrogenase (short-subunit alcohol dehydrogenase family)